MKGGRIGRVRLPGSLRRGGWLRLPGSSFLLGCVLLLGGCGEGRDAAVPVERGEGGTASPPGEEAGAAPAARSQPLTLTFTRDEAPVQVTRMVPVPTDPDRTPRAALLQAALQALTAGPLPEERDMGIQSFFHEGTSHLVQDLTFRGDTAQIDFQDLRAAVPNASSSTGSFHFLAELNGTVFAVPGVEAVEYRMEGSCEAFWNFLQRGCQVVPRPGSA